jgi:hypothetical protein
VNGLLLPFQIRALTHLGVKSADLLALDYPRAYVVRNLFYPSTTSAICMPPLTFQPAIIDWLRDKFLRPGVGSRRAQAFYRSLWTFAGARATFAQ